MFVYLVYPYWLQAPLPIKVTLYSSSWHITLWVTLIIWSSYVAGQYIYRHVCCNVARAHGTQRQFGYATERVHLCGSLVLAIQLSSLFASHRLIFCCGVKLLFRRSVASYRLRSAHIFAKAPLVRTSSREQICKLVRKCSDGIQFFKRLIWTSRGENPLSCKASLDIGNK